MKRVLSLGGGLDSFAMLVRSIQLGEPPDIVVFVDVGAPGDPGEWPSTYRHVREVVMPLCEEHGIEFVWIDHEMYPVRDARSLFAWMWDRGQIPVSGPNRICTTVAKVERFEQWMDDRCPGQVVEVWIGFDAGEAGRAEKDPNAGKRRKASSTRAARINRFPLIEWGICRCRGVELVREAGFPIPRKSACVFCPYASRADWRRFAAELPEQFGLVAELEERKPLTGNGRKLSIMAYDSDKQEGTPLRKYVASIGRPRKPKPCTVCGAAERATKATGCDYLEEAGPDASTTLRDLPIAA